MELRQLRPVGHKFNLVTSPLDKSFFYPYRFLGFGSGTQALAAALIAVKKRSNSYVNSEVLVPAYTCPDVISACSYAGVKVRLVDFSPNSCFIDINDLATKINHRTIAIIAINFLGMPENIKAIKKVAPDIPIIEDSAQGMAYASNNDYWQGDLVVLSFGRGKPLNLLAGGAVLYRDIQWEQHIPDLKLKNDSFKARVKYALKRAVFEIGSTPLVYYWITRIPGLSIGETKFKPINKLEPITSQVLGLICSAIIQYRDFNQDLTEYKEVLNKSPELAVFPASRKLECINTKLLRFPLLILSKELKAKVLSTLNLKGVSCMYQKVLPDMKDMPTGILCNPDEKFINARRFAENLVTLPCFNDLRKEDYHVIGQDLLNILYGPKL